MQSRLTVSAVFRVKNSELGEKKAQPRDNRRYDALKVRPKRLFRQS